MNSRFGHCLDSTTSQTLNKQSPPFLIEGWPNNLRLLVGRVLVSRTDNVGKTVSLQGKVSHLSSSRNLKGVVLLRQQLDGHGSRHSLRRV